jgi:hypothetical protein
MENSMPRQHYKTVSGKITHVFGHRFVITTEQGDVLADLTPSGLEHIALNLNDDVTREGEMKPIELKVVRLHRQYNPNRSRKEAARRSSSSC